MKKVIYLIVICLIIKTSFAEDFWKQIDKPIYGEFKSICSLSNGDLFTTSQLFPFGGGIYKSADNGRSWEKIEIGAYGQVCSDKKTSLL